jgi:hypothetical protein
MDVAANTTWPKKNYLASIVGLIGLAWLMVAGIHPLEQADSVQAAVDGIMWGTLFAHASLAATWAVLGPLPLRTRLPLAFGWLGAMLIALVFHLATDMLSRASFLEFLFDLGTLLATWILVQVFVWPLVRIDRLRIQAADSDVLVFARDARQYGVGTVLAVTAVVAIVLGAGRSALGDLNPGDFATWYSRVESSGWLALSRAILSFATLAAVLLLRNTRAIVAAIGIALVATLIGMPMFFSRPFPLWARNYAFESLVCMNLSQCIWIMGVLILLKSAGFRLRWGYAEKPTGI